MWIYRRFKIREHERGLYFKDREFKWILDPGRYWIFDPFYKVRVETVSVRDVWLKHEDLDVIVKSGELGDQAKVLDLRNDQRALVWIDGRMNSVLGPGRYALWTVFHDVKVEIVDARAARLAHDRLAIVLQAEGASRLLDTFAVEAGHAGLFLKDGEHQATLGPGTYAFWKGVGKVRLETVDLRESMIDVAGQEIMTADKVSLRLNAVVTYKVAHALRAVAEVVDYRQALYRDAQLALRAVIGTKDLDAFLADKDSVGRELEGIVKNRAAAFGVEVLSLGIRDVILPGEMKDLMNKVTEAKKAAEASLITRREETAAMRSQANTARILESSPTLMRLRELEVLEKVAEKAHLNVVLGDKGLVEHVVKLV
ncbi:MAG: slipin family protein [Planctomycetes bacterium]|nr:slipin family protein [Planctomycetota bacterium]